MLPDRLLQRRGVIGRDIAIDLEEIDRPAVVTAEFQVDARVRAVRTVEQIVQLGMRDRRSQREPDVQVGPGLLWCNAYGRVEMDDDVGVLALRTDEIARVSFTFLQFRQHLFSRVAAFGRVTL